MLNQRYQTFGKEKSVQIRRVGFVQDHQDSYQLMVQRLKSQKTEGEDRCLYEQPLKKDEQEEKGTVKKRIDLAIILIEQNDELTKKIGQVTKQLEEQQLKTCIFSQQYQKKRIQISTLTTTLQTLKKGKDEQKLQTLNQSSIPNKSAEMSTTINTNCWINEFLNKEDLQTLWTNRRQGKAKEEGKQEKTVKKYTLDLNAAVQSDRLKKTGKMSNSCSIREDSTQRSKKEVKNVDKSKKTISSIAYKARETRQTSRYDLKLSINDKNKKMGEMWQKTRCKPLSYMRNAKKIKNPEL